MFQGIPVSEEQQELALIELPWGGLLKSNQLTDAEIRKLAGNGMHCYLLALQLLYILSRAQRITDPEPGMENIEADDFSADGAAMDSQY